MTTPRTAANWSLALLLVFDLAQPAAALEPWRHRLPRELIPVLIEISADIHPFWGCALDQFRRW